MAEMCMVDWAKLFFALCVFALHAGLGADAAHYDVACALVLRLAVPYFFVASGFFLGQGVHAKGRGMAAVYGGKGLLARLGWKLLAFEPLSLLAFIAKELGKGAAPGAVLRECARSVLFYPKGALWYIQALIVAVLLLSPLIRRGRERAAIPAGIALYCLAALCNRYHFLIAGTRAADWVRAYRAVFVTARNGLFVGVYYVAVGMALSRAFGRFAGRERLVRRALLAAYALYAAEVFAIRSLPAVDDGSLYLSHLFLAPLLFLATAQCPPAARRGARLARSLSASVYLLHRPALSWLELFCAAAFHAGLTRAWSFLAAAALIAAVCAPIYARKKPRLLYDLLR